MAFKLCSSNCIPGGYKYWTVEYGGECYCGDSFAARSVVANGGNGEYGMSCPGKGLAFCRNGNKLSVYQMS